MARTCVIIKIAISQCHVGAGSIGNGFSLHRAIIKSLDPFINAQGPPTLVNA